ncbi:hypothetical protein EVAR_36362_1 [Eumeta japonica]|uniref:Uncharacterized protein n=1 Tax=Eumeta variegata TaxID=151549 RepID=A0A4C1W759_EUMVA|nr:hypothetical protein EVAR_36362_1 [Eumeta japonica]
MPEWKGRVPLTRSHCERITRSNTSQNITAKDELVGHPHKCQGEVEPCARCNRIRVIANAGRRPQTLRLRRTWPCAIYNTNKKARSVRKRTTDDKSSRASDPNSSPAPRDAIEFCCRVESPTTAPTPDRNENLSAAVVGPGYFGKFSTFRRLVY